MLVLRCVPAFGQVNPAGHGLAIGVLDRLAQANRLSPRRAAASASLRTLSRPKNIQPWRPKLPRRSGLGLVSVPNTHLIRIDQSELRAYNTSN